ncbi:DUF1211 domain-containing protein [Modestobacter sp. L9-4]|uniref:TMEM175 family protein n=1 Tax=Modestobacter sp. L9-4 TaxID=2851567 RepID=UPI001C78A3C1|nr:TMEM175 family protein [Modestobacter sp. L9-4]QXG76619.1 DUF1211 domain-containing protein [Modestobacter sp. L9-4]
MTDQRADRSRGRVADTGRVEAFSDGVLAIVITLLVLDLRAPEEEGEFLTGLLDQWPVYVAYLASFGYVGVIWVNHHQLFTRIEAVDGGLLWRNLVLLLATSVLPFPTAVLGSAFQHGDHHDQQVALVGYASVAACMCLAWLAVYRYLARHGELIAPDTPASWFLRERWRALLGLAADVAAAGAGIWQPVAGLVIAALLPVFYGLTSGGLSGTPAEA